MNELQFILIHNGVNTTLTHAPDGWNEQMVNADREESFLGIMRNYSIPLLFVREGADIIRTGLYTEGLKTNIVLRIYKRNRYTNVYELKFTGKLALANYEDTADGIKVEVVAGGVYADVTNKMDIPYNITYGSNRLNYSGIASTFETVVQKQKDQGFDLYDVLQLSSLQVSLANPLPFTFKENDFADYQGGYMAFHDYTMTTTQPITPVPGTTYPVEVLKDCRIMISVMPLNVRCYQWGDPGDPWVTMKYQMKLFRVRGGNTTTLASWADTYCTTDQTQEPTPFSIEPAEYMTGELVALAGDVYWVGLERTFHWSDTGQVVFANFWISWEDAVMLKTTIIAPLPSTQFKCLTGIELFTELGQKIGGYPVKSDFLTNFETDNHDLSITGQQLCFISGMAIRELTANFKNKLYMTITLRKFIHFMRVAWGCGFGIEKINGVDTMVIEEMSHFLNGSNVYNLPSNTSVTRTMAIELINSAINIGYPKFDYDDTFGLDEFNGTLEMKTPVIDVTSRLDLISDIRADGAGIDYVRKNELFKNITTKEVKKSKDVQGDGSVWCVFAKFNTTNIYDTYNTYVNASGTTYPEHQVNYFLSPKRCLQRNGAFIRSFLWGFDADDITYQTTESNNELVVQMPGEGVDIVEIADVPVNSLDSALFHPIFLTFSVPGRYGIIDFLEQYAAGMFTFNYNGTLLKGILMGVKISLAYDKPSEIKMLSHISNDLTIFVQ